jgi:hypothetical protein
MPWKECSVMDDSWLAGVGSSGSRKCEEARPFGEFVVAGPRAAIARVREQAREPGECL